MPNNNLVLPDQCSKFKFGYLTTKFLFSNFLLITMTQKHFPQSRRSSPQFPYSIFRQNTVLFLKKIYSPAFFLTNQPIIARHAYLQEVETDGEISVGLVTLEAIPASSEVFIDYGTGYYNTTPPRAIPGSRDVRLLPVWKAFELMHCKVKEVKKKWSELPQQ